MRIWVSLRKATSLGEGKIQNSKPKEGCLEELVPNSSVINLSKKVRLALHVSSSLYKQIIRLSSLAVHILSCWAFVRQNRRKSYYYIRG